MSISGISGGSSAWAASYNRQSLQGSGGAAGLASDPNSLASLESFFKEPAQQQMQEMWLKQHGITKAQFDAMSPDQKQKILTEMKQDLQKQMKQKAQEASQTATNILV